MAVIYDTAPARTLRSRARVISGLLAFASAGCVGDIGDGADDGVGPGGTDVPQEEVKSEIAVSGLRRLSNAEYRQTIRDLLGVDAGSASGLLPADALAPFDNDYTLQTPSESLIKGVEIVAGDVATAVVDDPALRVKATGCEPAGPEDDACYRAFVEGFGRRALRRPLSAEEIDRFAELSAFGVEAGDFWVGVSAGLRAFLQHPELLYRVEIGVPVAAMPGVHRLDDFELAARLSYFLLGTTPPDWLLDAAEAGGLDAEEGVEAAATELLADPRARARFNRFHAMWLGYETLSREGVFGAMHAETNALLERVIFDERRAWTDVLVSETTFVTPELAAHYGLPSPGAEPGWVDYGDSGRQGILSHGTLLSAVPKFGDTSPTQRGLLVRAQLFCDPIGPPPPDLNVVTDMPPDNGDPDACKKDRYFMVHEPACKGCHEKMDPIGFGLEAFDTSGRFRTHEPNKPECVIDGEGELPGFGKFNGPAQLGERAVESGEVEACVAWKLYSFAVGREKLDVYDRALLDRVVAESSAEGGLRLDTVIRNYVTSEAFRFRREENVQ